MFDIDQNLKNLPDTPGVYIHKDKLGNIIYVGKAINLRNRVRQYFQSQRNMQPKVRSMVENIAEFEYITVDSEMEALILECNLIKRHRPKYNILLRDDKTYPYIKVTNEEWPRVIKTRTFKKDGGAYFGPYSDVGAVNMIVDLLNRSFSLKRCSTLAFPSGFRPCLNYHIKQCPGICTGLYSHSEYEKAIAQAMEFLRGRDGSLRNTLKAKMNSAAEAMEYEEAAEYRDYIEAAKALSETQRVVLHHSSEADIVVHVDTKPSKSGEEKVAESNSSDMPEFAPNYMAVFNVRDGKLIGRESFRMDIESSIDDSYKDITSAFIKQHYSNVPNIPKEILLEAMPGEEDVLEEFLSDLAGHRVHIIKPERGEKRALVKLAAKDAKEMAKTIVERARANRERKETLGREIWRTICEIQGEPATDRDSGSMSATDRDSGSMGALEYDGREFRVEAYDISNTNGVDTVGAMVVFKGLKPDKRSYRKFKVRTVKGQDDYASMREVLSRRFNRLFSGDDKFAEIPDIIFMDGGKGHVTTALEVIEPCGFEIPIVGMVKDEHHRTRALTYRTADQEGKFEWREILLSDKPLLYKYIGTIQEEVHRFAIDYHHKLRSKNIEKSVLDEIEGIGPKRRKALLEAFGSVDAIKQIVASRSENSEEEIEKKASPVDVLAEIPGMSRTAAEKVCDFFSLMV